MKKYNLEIYNNDTCNMSNWQITHTVNTLTTVNNKFEILKKLNNYINMNIEEKDIFIIDKSYSFNTNYKTYFSSNAIFEEKQFLDIYKISNMGNIYTLGLNEDIVSINILIEVYRKFNSIVNKNLKNRLNKNLLIEAYNMIFTRGLDSAINYLKVETINYLLEMLNKRKAIKANEKEKVVNEIKNFSANKIYEKYRKLKNDDMMNKFMYFFTSCTRPIVGIYDRDTHQFGIINADQMYQNGEDSNSQIRLQKITKNSPVYIAFIVVGVMAGVIKYLSYREHGVEENLDKNEIQNIPHDRKTALENIIKNSDNSLIYKNSGNNYVDEKVLQLALDTYSKLESVTDNKKVKLDYSEKKEDK